MFIVLHRFYFSTAFAPGSCYEPFVKYGNFSTSDPAFGVGSVVEFTCEPGYTLEQGAVILECVNDENPQWNETEPACRGDFVCVMSLLACRLIYNLIFTSFFGHFRLI